MSWVTGSTPFACSEMDTAASPLACTRGSPWRCATTSRGLCGRPSVCGAMMKPPTGKSLSV
eukprot:scaffold6976_cov69-Phaeocystis_antarctica.AAC.3